MRLPFCLPLLLAACTPFETGSSASGSGSSSSSGGPGGPGDAGGPSGDALAPGPGGPLGVTMGHTELPSPPAITTHVCALVTGAVRCWGNSQFGQALSNPIDADAVEIAAGYDHTCARMANGDVKCWGYNYHGQVGVKDSVLMKDALKPTHVALSAKAARVAAGYGHSCALLEGGSVTCWGKRNDGEMGTMDPVTNAPNWWMPFALPGSAIAVGLGRKQTCVLAPNGVVSCTGGNGAGESGKATSNVFVYGLNLIAIVDVKALAVGAGHVCALTGDTRLSCWGAGSNFGGTNATNVSPVQLPGSGYVAVAAGSHTCALGADKKTITCFGTPHARLGAATGNVIQPAVAALAVAGDTSCAMATDGALYCWGDLALFGSSVGATSTPTRVN